MNRYAQEIENRSSFTQEYQSLMIATKRLSHAINNKGRAKTDLIFSKEDIMSLLFELLHNYNLALLKSEIFESKSVSKNHYQLHFSGTFSNIVDFLSQVAESRIPIIIGETSLSREGSIVEVMMLFNNV